MKYLLNFALAPADRDLLMDALLRRHFGSDEATISRELYMTVEQIAELGREQSIGTHAHEHLPLGLLSEEAGRSARAIGQRCIDTLDRQPPFALSYPYGSREASSPAVAAGGGTAGDRLRVHDGTGRPIRDLSAPLHLARFDNNDVPGGKAARCSIDELFDAAALRTWFAEPALASERKLKVLGIIPARRGSKRLAGKNMRPLAGKPLAAWTIEAGATSPAARSAGRVVRRSGGAAIWPPVRFNLAARASGRDWRPTSRRRSTTCAMHSRVLESRRRAVRRGRHLAAQLAVDLGRRYRRHDRTVGVVGGRFGRQRGAARPCHPSAENEGALQGDRLLPYVEEERGRMAAHELPDIYVRNCSVYATRRASIERGQVIGDDCRGYVMPRERSLDINEEFDLQFAEFLLSRKGLG